PSQQRRYYGGQEENALGSEGKQTFGPLEAGPMRVAMQIQAEGEQWWQAMRAGQLEVSLKPGDNSVLFPIPALYSVVVEVAGAGQGGGVQLTRVEESGGNNENFNEYGGMNAQLDAQ